EDLADVADAPPGELGDVDEALDAGGELDERAEVGDVGDAPGDLAALGDLVGRGGEGVGLDLLHAQGEAVGVPVDLEDLAADLLADLEVALDRPLAVAHAVVGDVRDVDEAVHAADVDERAEGHDLADGALDDL